MTHQHPRATALSAIRRGVPGLLLFIIVASTAALAADPALPRLQVSDNGRFLVTAAGQPFFWLGDTAWYLFGKSVRDDSANQPSARLYFANRAAKGFTVIQAIIVPPPQADSTANAYGYEPFENGDWSQPRIGPAANDDYWDQVDWCVAEAKRLGLRLAAAPRWLEAVTDQDPMVRDSSLAYRYGRFLGGRYPAEPHLIWMLGGDAWGQGRNVDTPSRLALVRAMAEGIADGVAGVDHFDGQADWRNTLMTFHPPGNGHSSAEWLHTEPWLDFNMIQTTTRFAFQNWETVGQDYARQPPKPTLDAEVAYEGSLSLRRNEPQDRRIGPDDVRRAAYWGVFAGGCGHSYGHRSFIGWIRQGEIYRFGAHIPWYESLDAPGAFQMGHLRRLIESLPDPLQRVPDQSLLVGDAGSGNEHIAATRDTQGRCALVYSAAGKPFTLDLARLSGDKLRAAWFDPRQGTYQPVGDIARHGTQEFTPPTHGAGQDWVLVLNDASRHVQLPSPK